MPSPEVPKGTQGHTYRDRQTEGNGEMERDRDRKRQRAVTFCDSWLEMTLAWFLQYINV